MAYSVTGMTAPPDVGFQSGARHTAQGARDLALAFIVAGLHEVEVRDPRGNLKSIRQLDAISEEHGLDERTVAARLAAL